MSWVYSTKSTLIFILFFIIYWDTTIYSNTIFLVITLSALCSLNVHAAWPTTVLNFCPLTNWVWHPCPKVTDLPGLQALTPSSWQLSCRKSHSSSNSSCRLPPPPLPQVCPPPPPPPPVQLSPDHRLSTRNATAGWGHGAAGKCDNICFTEVDINYCIYRHYHNDEL